MAMQPGGAPNFEFDTGIFDVYDHVEVAQRVIWPFVDVLWRDDWREQSWPNDDLSVFRHGKHRGVHYGAHVTAKTVVEPFEVATAYIDVHQALGTTLRNAFIEEAEEQIEKVRSRGNSFYDNELTARASVSYAFDTDDQLEIETRHYLETPDGETIWVSGAISAEGHTFRGHLDPVLYTEDMERLTSGLHVLKAPKAIMRALKSIRQTTG